jgi:hypothetical protein
MIINITDKILFEEQCVIDEAKVFYFQNRVLRAIYNNEQAKLYRKILSDGSLQSAFQIGLVKTKIADDLILDNCSLIIEHEKIDFFLHPVEMTNLMFWNCALSFIKISKELSKHNLVLKDAHPWNLTYHKGKPVFFDFSSVADAKQYNNNWLDEFYTYFAVSLRLAASKWSSLANEYRKQHANGFGIALANKKISKKLFFRSFNRLPQYFNEPYLFLQKLEEWIIKQQTKTGNGTWDNYDQGHNASYEKPETLKQKFVYNILKENNPDRVTDLATNKGYYGFMAEHLGSKVIAFDYEEFSVNEAIKFNTDKNITFCQLNFVFPTPAYGWSLIGPDSFSRFKSDIALALGLIHHICLTQKFPVKLFCDTCAKYSDRGVILEFVFPEDKYVKEWNLNIPADYTLAAVKNYFGKHFNKVQYSDLIDHDGIKRQLLFFYAD